MTETLCTSGAVKLKAGANRPTDDTVLTATNYTTFINEAESFINCQLRYNFTDNYAGLNADFAKILEDAASSYAALKVISYDMSGYSNRYEAQVMLDFNWAIVRECLNLLRDTKFKDVVLNDGVQ